MGLIKIKTFRPFPLAAIKAALSRVKAIGVVDRAVSFSWNCGPLYQDILGALYHLPERVPAVSFIGGLAGADITPEDFTRVIETVARVRDGERIDLPIWLNEDA